MAVILDPNLGNPRAHAPAHLACGFIPKDVGPSMDISKEPGPQWTMLMQDQLGHRKKSSGMGSKLPCLKS
jgi:hypothetical protein